jgi:nitrogen fixation-related uncharacterized protein
MQWSAYIILGMVFASVFFVCAAYALYWAHKNGQLSNFEEGAKSIFDEEEPQGDQTDFFPGKDKSKPSSPNGPNQSR